MTPTPTETVIQLLIDAVAHSAKKFDSSEIFEFAHFLVLARCNDSNCSPSPRIDAVWHWMLLNTRLSEMIHEVLGGVVHHSTIDADDMSIFQLMDRRMRSLRVLNSNGFMPNLELWKVPGFIIQTSIKRETRSSAAKCVNVAEYQSQTYDWVVDPNGFFIFMKNICDRRERIRVTMTTTIAEAIVAFDESLASFECKAIYQGQVLAINTSIGACNITPDACITVILNLRGC